MEYVNPAIVLAASASRAGCFMLARDILRAGRGLRDCKSVRKSITRLAGLDPVSVALLIEHSLITTGSADLRRPHINSN